MNRLTLTLVSVLGAASLSACGAQQFGSVCDDPATAPATCGQTCDARPGAPATCGTGLYCSEDGVCDAQCGGTLECPSGYVCTSEGRCSDDPSDNDPGPAPDADTCPAIQFTPMPLTPSIQLVLDQSGSMFNNNVTRYVDMTAALVGGNGVVTALDDKAYFGSLLYTCSGSNNAFTIVPRALNNEGPIRASIESKTGGENTPTAAAIRSAVQGYLANPPPAGSPPVIVLATDGEPNTCDGPLIDFKADSVAAAREAFAAGFPVYVLAMDINSQHFQDLANAGQGHIAGQPNIPYYPTTNAAQLQAAFQTIINGVISCDLSLTSPIDETKASQGIVTINGVQINYGTDWTLVNGNIIRVQGAACQTLKTTPNAQVSAEFPCGSIIL